MHLGARGRQGVVYEIQDSRSNDAGRKISLGRRSRDGIRVTGILHSLVESAKLCGVDPGAYLRAALDGATIPLPAELS